MLFVILVVVAVVDCCEVSVVHHNSTFQYTIDGDYKHIDWKYNDSLIICSDGLVYQQFNLTVKCDNLSLEFDTLYVSIPSITIECKTNNGTHSVVTLNTIDSVKYLSTPLQFPEYSLIPSTKRLYYYLPLSLIPPAWFTVLLIHYVDTS